MSVSTRETARNLWQILFQLQGSIWSAVLPYCVLNCTLMIIIEVLANYDIRIAFSPSGHGLMTLIVSFLVISKVNLAYDRYMNARHAIGHALSALRELNQSALTYTLPLVATLQGRDDQKQSTTSTTIAEWRKQTAIRIIDLMDCTIRVLKNRHQANYLARNVDVEWNTKDDPMQHALALRIHLYTINQQIISSPQQLQKGDVVHQPLELLERMKMVDLLQEFVANYRNLLKCASTPLPFPMVQMGRTFLFLWTFSIPLVLRGVVSEIYSAMAFVFFLTYGFVGLELVSVKLMYPFGDGQNDLNVTGMREATTIGIENDFLMFGSANEKLQLRDPRLEYSRQKPKPPLRNHPLLFSGNTTNNNNNNSNTKTDKYDKYYDPTTTSAASLESVEAGPYHHTAGGVGCILHPSSSSHANAYHPAP